MQGRLDAFVPGARAEFSAGSRAGRERLKITASVRFGSSGTAGTSGTGGTSGTSAGPIGRDNAEFATVLVTFPDGTICEMERQVRSSRVKYRLDLRERDGQLEEKRGTCTPASVPPLAGGVVSIVHDDDDDPGTPNAPLFTRGF